MTTHKHNKNINNKTQKHKKKGKRGTELHCRLKSCKASMYKSVYGMSGGGSIRSNIHPFC
jgi:hypothetical protein